MPRPLLLVLACAGLPLACAREHQIHVEHRHVDDGGRAVEPRDHEELEFTWEETVELEALSEELVEELDEAQALERFAAAVNPGAQHEALATLVGTWRFTATMWWEAGAPPTESTGSSRFEMVLGGRYLVEHSEGETMMGPFAGMGILGFDNVTGRFHNAWYDTMNTGVMVARGRGEAAGTIEWRGTFTDALRGKLKMRAATTRVSDDELRYELWVGRGADEFKMMDIVYERE